MTPFQERVGRLALKWMTGANTVAFRMSRGRVAGQVPTGAPICLLTTTGRRTGRPRTVPLLFLPYSDDGDDRIVLVASHGGMSTHPGWYLNLLDEPRATVEWGSHSREMVARQASDAERAEVWPRLTAAYAHFDAYQGRTARHIPVLILSPVADPHRRAPTPRGG
jgi:F420H(2)-dependent quinone reductase